jgi:hypothetical protein
VCASIGCTSAEGSPFTSRASESCPAMTCGVFNFPVPVAPARDRAGFIMDRGTRTRTSVSTSPPKHRGSEDHARRVVRIAGTDFVLEALAHGR